MSEKPFSRVRTFIVALLMAGFGVALSLLMIVLLIRVFPQLEPGGQRFIFTELDGDTFRHQPGQVRPPAENRVLEDVTRFDDADGFRRPVRVAEQYPIAALGDSFTDGGQVPWPDVLARELDTPVRNLGWSGFGPVEYARIAETYLADDHEWVLVAYFEGNDLSNAMTAYQRAQETGGVLELDLTRNVAPPKLELTDLEDYDDLVLNADDNYLYPLVHPDLNGLELAYISDYIWWLNGDAETYRESRNMQVLGDALAAIKAAAGDACVALVYVPVKGHIYFEHADPDGNRRYVLENAVELTLNEEGWLAFNPPQAVDFETLMARMDNQREAVRDVASSAGLEFIDLIPAFQAAVSGDQLYYTYDSHWNVNGHALAGETVAEYIRANPCGG